MGGKFLLKLNTGERPIANKYREGKMKRTLKRELKVLEIAKREALETSHARVCNSSPFAFIVSCGSCGFVMQCKSRSIRHLQLREKAARKVGSALGHCCYSLVCSYRGLD
jgi:hypothetical protein